MGYEQHRPVHCLPFVHDVEHEVGLLRCERSRDFVEHEEAGVEGECPSEVDEPQRCKGDVADQESEVESAELQAFEPRFYVCAFEARNGEVLVQGEVGNQRGVLVHRCDPRAAASLGTVNAMARRQSRPSRHPYR